MKARAVVFGAVSIINAIAGGWGATLSINLRTEALVELTKAPGELSVVVNGRPRTSPLALETVRAVLRKVGEDPTAYSGSIQTRSDAPIGVGLKTSSSSSVAVAMAALSALGRRGADTDPTVLECSVEASLASGASITGALDDAAACLLGGMNHTDNLARKIMRSNPLERPVRVALLIPVDQGSNRAAVKPEFVRRFSKMTNEAFRMSMEGEPWEAMTLNGLIYSSIYGYDPSPALDALNLGALGAGLSGTGPAVAAVFETGNLEGVEALKKEWSRNGGRVIITESNNEHGRTEVVN